MALRLNQADAEFVDAFTCLVERRRDEEDDVREAVTRICDEVRRGGDSALASLTTRYDRFETTPQGLRLSRDEIATARDRCQPETIEALELAAERIRAFHERQMPADVAMTDALGVEQRMRWRPIDSVGLYVPGGSAAYPSSVLMNAIPARVAGCRRLAITVPTPDGEINPLVLAAAELAGVDEIWRIGGAQAVAALAYGTESIAPVDKVVGPGNAYVAEAKRQLFGRIGIDMIAGPSEILVVADETASPSFIASDLLSQAEHDPRAQAILITDDGELADRVEAEVERQLALLPRAEIAGASWRDEGCLITVRDLAEAVPLIDRLASEHLELIGPRAEVLEQDIAHAGSIFLGAFTPEVIGDYVGGPNHVLPTGRSARFASGLGVFDFLKRTTLLRCSREAFAELGPAAERLAHAEGLDAHAEAVAHRRRAN